MNIKKWIGCSILATGLVFSTVTLASPCDNMPISVVGYEHYKYSIILGQGSFDKDGSLQTAVSHKTASSDGAVYRVFSGKGTRGRVMGEIIFTSLDTDHSISLPFTLYKNASCVGELPIKFATLDKAHIIAQSARNAGIVFMINEYK